MKSLAIGVWFVCALFFVGCAASVPPRVCTGSDCHVVARPVPWPDRPAFKAGMPVHFGPFQFALPPGIQQLRVSASKSLLVAEYENSRFVMELINKDDLRIHGAYDEKDIGIRVADIPRILFMETPASPEPKNRDDLALWRSVIRWKRVQFQGQTPSFVADKDGIFVYFMGESVSGWDSHASITTEIYPEFYLTISGFGEDLDSLRNVISTVHFFSEGGQ